DRVVDVRGKKMHVGKSVMTHRVDLDQLLVRAVDVHVIVVRTGQGRQRRMNIDVVSLPPLILVLDVHSTPTDVPDAGVELTGRRGIDLVEQNERLLSE